VGSPGFFSHPPNAGKESNPQIPQRGGAATKFRFWIEKEEGIYLNGYHGLTQQIRTESFPRLEVSG